MGCVTLHAVGANALLLIGRTAYKRESHDILCNNADQNLNFIYEEEKFYAQTVSWHKQRGLMQKVLYKAVLITKSTIFG